jgi:hypothetical protein
VEQAVRLLSFRMRSFKVMEHRPSEKKGVLFIYLEPVSCGVKDFRFKTSSPDSLFHVPREVVSRKLRHTPQEGGIGCYEKGLKEKKK